MPWGLGELVALYEEQLSRAWREMLLCFGQGTLITIPYFDELWSQRNEFWFDFGFASLLIRLTRNK